MDKASIVTDAIVYVKDLQNRVQVMRTDVEALEAFSSRNQDCLGAANPNSADMKRRNITPIIKNKFRPARSPDRKHKILKVQYLIMSHFLVDLKINGIIIGIFFLSLIDRLELINVA